LLRFFREIEYPICFSTKGTWWLDDSRYTELFKDNPLWNVKVTIITLDEYKTKRIERGAPVPSERLNAIKKIADLNCGGATLRLRPFIIGITNPSHLELIKQSAENGATAVSTEFFCLEQRSNTLKEKLKIMIKLAGFDLLEYYKINSSGSGYLRLNRKTKKPFMQEMKSLCDELKIRFYVSDAHFKELCHNGCCCGLDESWNYSRGQFNEALMIAKTNGIVCWDDIKKDMELLYNYKWVQAKGYNTNSIQKRLMFHNFTMIEYLRWLWNNPKSGQNPYKMFGKVLYPVNKDDDGNLIYKYDKTKSL